MNPNLTSLCLRLETAQAEQNRAVAEAAALLNPASGARCERVGGACAIYLGPGHMLNQGLVLGLQGPLEPEDLDRLEAILGRPTVLELSAGADPSAATLLASRGYRIRMFQQVWMRDLDPAEAFPGLPGAEIRPIRSGEEDTFTRVVFAGFSETDDLASVDPTGFGATTSTEGTTCFLAFVDGEPAGGGTVAVSGDVAVLSGTAVLPRFRGRGLQGALIRARLAHGRARGGILATSATLPGTASQASLLRCGFRVAYPKLELERG
ncbi:MAG: GNAT family N-acetyltransferase [Holophagaceae bacterium]